MIEALERPEFAAVHDGARIVLTGTADSQVAPALHDWLLAVHRAGPWSPELVVDLVGLEFMTGGCIKCFIDLILAIESATDPYRIRFLANHDAPWQQRSLRALACLASNLVTISE